MNNFNLKELICELDNCSKSHSSIKLSSNDCKMLISFKKDLQERIKFEKELIEEKNKELDFKDKTHSALFNEIEDLRGKINSLRFWVFDLYASNRIDNMRKLFYEWEKENKGGNFV